MKKTVQNVFLRYAEKVAGYKSPKEAVQDAINDLNYLPNGVASWVDAYGGDKAKADANGKKIRKIVEELSQVLMEMPEPVTFNVYGLDKNYSFENRKDFIKFMESKGYKHTGDNHNKANRAELQGQPVFKNMSGPMYDGGGKVRYETWELNDALSR
jgi:hypothetical protein